MNLKVLTLFMCLLSFGVTINPKKRGKFDVIFGKTQENDEDSKFEENGENEDILEDEDFEDDDSDNLMNMMDSTDANINSLTHLHVSQGEVLVPCFGMWWPVGGGSATYYDYGVDYYGDYKKKRRRSRKRNKAKMKKKRS